ncbi:MFS transporter [Trueperella sp. LYQ143]|uniref:MFS transporter n=1 Tax=unclassified Trueperella TaxID=2630174 RepID=UPI0039838650
MSNSVMAGYRELPRLVGIWHMVISFFGRLPISMIIIGVLTLIVNATDSVEIAAYCSAALAISNAVGNVLIGRLTDRYGQRRPLLAIAPINVIALLSLVMATRANAPSAVLVGLSALIGVSTCPIGPLTRVRWYPLASSHQLPAAMSWETVNDELVFVLGPAAVGILAAAIHPAAPLVISALLVATCVIPFALSRFALPPAISATHTPSFARIMRRIRTPFITMWCMGMFFGAMQTSVTAFAKDHGIAVMGGLIYSAMGLSAAITALLAVGLPARMSHVTRIWMGGIGLAGGALLCVCAHHVALLAVFLFIAGLFIGPVGVAIFTLAGQWAPRGGDGVANTAIVSANVLGVATANTLIGKALESHLSLGFMMAAGFGLAMMLVALSFGRYDEHHLRAVAVESGR